VWLSHSLPGLSSKIVNSSPFSFSIGVNDKSKRVNFRLKIKSLKLLEKISIHKYFERANKSKMNKVHIIPQISTIHYTVQCTSLYTGKCPANNFAIQTSLSKSHCISGGSRIETYFSKIVFYTM